MTTILSIQSSVAYGHVGNSAATFPLMRRGIEVWPVYTVHFSNNTSYSAWRGPTLSATDVLDVVRGIDDRGVLGRCDAVLSGYQGGEETGSAVLQAVELVRSRNPNVVYCCDPVMGDVDRGVYVRPSIPKFMTTKVVPAAQVITPNQFELGLLTGMPTSTTTEVLTAARTARDLGPRTVLVTSVEDENAPAEMSMIMVDGDGAWQVTTPKLAQTFTGAGDLTAAVFLGGLLTARDPVRALADTAAIAYGVLSITAASGERELQLVAAQDTIAAPARTFDPVRLT
ncbi:pyridoxal kinase PdxY [Microlunatus elymi]|uniref:pyridoxal kinase n=1 Tax=Microlunatus elymi TaxID=2596828 RepID=A0A516Q0D4_9ACTN|nr:pyridoxal kinase PdxY [Microlunatus elymi]QDP96857.1 pyridoxal kinase PdxY [Microlunatus elymi]